MADLLLEPPQPITEFEQEIDAEQELIALLDDRFPSWREGLVFLVAISQDEQLMASLNSLPLWPNNPLSNQMPQSLQQTPQLAHWETLTIKLEIGRPLIERYAVEGWGRVEERLAVISASAFLRRLTETKTRVLQTHCMANHFNEMTTDQRFAAVRAAYPWDPQQYSSTGPHNCQEYAKTAFRVATGTHVARTVKLKTVGAATVGFGSLLLIAAVVGVVLLVPKAQMPAISPSQFKTYTVISKLSSV